MLSPSAVTCLRMSAQAMGGNCGHAAGEYDTSFDAHEDGQAVLHDFAVGGMVDSGDRQGDVASPMRAINAYIERWVIARPQEWLWLHRRWPKEPGA